MLQSQPLIRQNAFWLPSCWFSFFIEMMKMETFSEIDFCAQGRQNIPVMVCDLWHLLVSHANQFEGWTITTNSSRAVCQFSQLVGSAWIRDKATVARLSKASLLSYSEPEWKQADSMEHTTVRDFLPGIICFESDAFLFLLKDPIGQVPGSQPAKDLLQFSKEASLVFIRKTLHRNELLTCKETARMWLLIQCEHHFFDCLSHRNLCRHVRKKREKFMRQSLVSQDQFVPEWTRPSSCNGWKQG